MTKFIRIIIYTNSLVNADSFYANFTNTTFQKEPRYMYLTRIPSLTRSASEKKSRKARSWCKTKSIMPCGTFEMLCLE